MGPEASSYVGISGKGTWVCCAGVEEKKKKKGRYEGGRKRERE